MQVSLLILLACCLTGTSGSLWAQTAEESAVLSTVNRVFDGMRKADTALFRSAFHESARLLSTMSQNGATVYQYESIDRFVEAINRPRADVWDERITGYQIRIDDGIALVWTDYSFYIGSRFTHCGVNALTLLRTAEGWKIVELADTRRIAPCSELQTQSASKNAINQLLDAWHKAAATADAGAFFGAMTPDAIYLGTDAGERWLRDELREWSKEHFKKGSAWAFTPKKREIYLHQSGTVAWFEESLDTWMGECRGSGILSYEPEGWKIRHYHLSLPIPNDKMKSVMALLGKK